jgi:hypothetical protein
VVVVSQYALKLGSVEYFSFKNSVLLPMYLLNYYLMKYLNCAYFSLQKGLSVFVRIVK